MLAKNQCFEMTCDAFGQDAQGVCRHEGMAVFVPGLLPGERALVRIVKPEKRYAFGRVEKLLEKSPSRAEPFCPIYKRCGGCVCQHMTYEASLAFKCQQVQDLLQRVGGLSIEVPPVWGMAHPFGYRNKGAYPVAQTDGAFLAAYAAVDAGAKTVRIRPKDGKGRLFIAELRILGEGDAPPLEERVLLPGETLLYPGRWRISCESCATGSEIQTSFNTFCFSCANICGKLSVASRAAGDTILLHRRGGTRSVSKLLGEARIPVSQRAAVPVLRDGAGPLAVYGIGQSERAFPAPQEPFYKITISPISEEERE